MLVYIIQDDADYDKFFDENSALLNQAETTVKDEEEKKPEIDFGSGYTAAQIAQMRNEQEKTIKDLADKMDPADKALLETEIEEFKKVRATDDAAQIKPAMEEFSKKTYDVFGKIYQAQSAQAGAQGAGPNVNDDGTVDSEFTDGN